MTQKTVAEMIILNVKVSDVKIVIVKGLILAVVHIDKDDIDIEIVLIRQYITILLQFFVLEFKIWCLKIVSVVWLITCASLLYWIQDDWSNLGY